MNPFVRFRVFFFTALPAWGAAAGLLLLLSLGGCSGQSASGDHVDTVGAVLKLDPPAPMVTAGHTQQFTAATPWGRDVLWSVLPTSGGTVDGAGLFTASNQAGPCTVLAMWKSDVRYTAQSSVTVIPAPVAAVTPSTLAFTFNGTATASVAAQAGCTYLWTIQGGTLLQGETTPQVQFTATQPGTVQLSCTIANTAGETATSQVSVAVMDLPPVIHYGTSVATFTVGETIAPIQPTSTGGAVVTWAVSPPLPAGLTLDPLTGTIAGSPVQQFPATPFTFTATNSGGSSSATLILKVAVVPIISYSPSFLTLTKGVDMGSLIPSNTGGAATGWSISPTLPAGLLLDPAPGRIAGAPTVLAPQAAYSVVARNGGGNSNSVALTLAVVDIPPVIACSPTAFVLSEGVPIPPIVPAVSGGAAIQWSVSPTLPQGLILDPATGRISGTAAAAGTVTSTLTATNSGGRSNGLDLAFTVVNRAAAGSLSANTTVPLHGAPVSLTPVFSNGTGTLDPGIGAVTSSVSYSTAPLMVPATFTLTVTNAAGFTDSKALTVTPQAVAISPVAVLGGSTSASVGLTRTVHATVTGAADATVNWTADGGSFSPATTASGEDTTWTAPSAPGASTLTATAAADPGARSATTLAVVPLPAAASLIPATASPLYGATVALTPVFSGGTGRVDPDLGAVSSGSPVTSRPITALASFTLTVTNPAGQQAQAVSGPIVPQTVIISPISIQGGNTSVALNGNRTVSATVTGAVNGGVVWTTTAGSFSPTVTPSGASAVWTAPGTLGPCTLTATAAADGRTLATTTLTVVPPPTASGLTASDPNPPYGAAVMLTPTFACGTGALDPGIGAVVSGAPYSTGALTAVATYSLTVTNPVGAQATTSCTVTPQTVAVAPVATPRSILTVGAAGIALTSSVTGAADLGIDWSVTAGTITGGQGTAQLVWAAPTTPQTVTITATSRADGRRSASTAITVVAAPQAVSLVASNPAPLYGGTFTLTPTYAGGAGALDDGAACPASGSATLPLSADWVGPRNHTLTVTNPAGTQATASVTVTPAPVAVSQVAPAAAAVTVGHTQPFAATVTGAADASVLWSVDGIVGGNAAVGTVSAGGLYTAGTTTGAHTVKATASVDGTTNQTAVVTVYAMPQATNLAATKATLTTGTATTVTPTFSNGTAVIGTAGPNSLDLSGSATSATGVGTGNLGSSTTFTLTVINPAGTTATASCTVTVVAAATASITASTTTPLYGDTGTWIKPVFGGGTTSAKVGTTQGGSAISANPVSNATITVNGSAPGFIAAATYWVRATNDAGDYVDASVTVTPQAVAVGVVSPASASVTVGYTKSFTATVSGASDTTASWSVDGVAGGNASVGTVSAAGLFTAGATTGAHTIKATAAADGTTNQTAAVTVYAMPLATGLTAAKATITTGTATTITPTFSNGTAVIGITGPNSLDLSGSATSATGVGTGNLAASTTYTLTVTNPAGTSATANCTVTVVAAATASITASTTAPLYGATGTWVKPVVGGGATSAKVGTTQGGSDISASPVSNANITVNGSAPGFIAATTYWVRATNDAADYVDASVTVTPQAVAVGAVSPASASVTVGYTKTFSTTVSGTADTTVTWSVDGVAGGNASVGTVSAAGLFTAGTTTGAHAIKATAAADGTTNQTAAVTVYAMPLATGLTATKTTITTGTATTVTPTFSNGIAVIGTGGANSQDLTAAATSTVGVATGNLAATKTCTLTVTNPAGTTATATCTVTVVAAATASLTASTVNPLHGATGTWVKPVFGGGATSAMVGTTQGGSDISASPTSNANITVNGSAPGFIAATTYWVRATNNAGDYVDASVTLTPQTVSVTALSPANPTKTVNKTGIAFTSSVSGASITGLTWTVSAGSITGGQGTNSMTWTAPAAPQSGTITATSQGDNTKSAFTTVTVVAAATSSIAASTASPLYGATDVTVSPTFTGASSAKVGTALGGNQVTTTPTSGTPIAVQAAGFTGTTTYYLRATNAAGDNSDSNTGSVAPQAVTMDAITPAAPSVTTGYAKQFSSAVHGALNATVAWSVDGVNGGNASVGTIDGTALYTGGTTLGSHTVKATSNGKNTVNQTTTVTVMAVPTAGLAPSTTSPLFGAKVTLTPTFNVGTARIGTTGAGSSDLTASATSGTPIQTPAMTAPATYTVTVTNYIGGLTATATSGLITPQTVSVDTPTAARTVLSSGDTQTYTSAAHGASDATLAWSVDGVAGGNAVVGTVSSLGLYTAGTATEVTHTLTATSVGDPTKSGSTPVKVVALPAITAFTAADPLISENDTTSLTATFSNGAAGTARIGKSGVNSGDLTMAVLSGVAVPTQGLITTTTYTLTVANEAGANTSAALIVTVVEGSFTPTVSVGGARYGHTSTALPDGRVLISGGRDDSAPLNTSQVFDPTVPRFSDGGNLVTARYGHTATLLANTTVLVAGGNAGATTALAEIWNGSFASTGALKAPRERHTATLLPNGKVLFVGGLNGASPVVTAELYDPATGTSAYTAGNLNTARYSHSATLLSSGKVLIAGGTNGSVALKIAELFDPATGAFSVTGSLATARQRHAAVLMDDGTVTLFAGQGASAPLASAETYTVGTGTFATAAGTLGTARDGLTATLMAGGNVILAGGVDGSGAPVKGCELFTPGTGTFGLTGLLSTARSQHTATLLREGWAILVGGLAQGGSTSSAEFLDAQDGLTPALPDATIIAPVGAFRAQAGLAATAPTQGHVRYVWMITGGTITSGNGTSALTFSMPATGTATLDALVISDRMVPSHVRFVVTPKPVITSFTAAKPTVTVGSGTTLSWATQDADTLTIDQGIGTVTGTSTAATVGTLGSTTYTLTATNAGGSVTATTSILAVPPPIAASLTPALNPVPVGGNTTLTPLFSQGTGVIDHGLGSVASGPAYPTAAIAAPTTFTLTVTNPAGDTATASTLVGLQTVAVTAITGSAYVTSGLSADYASTVTGAVNTSTTWTAAAGTMVAGSGHFTAPTGHPYDQVQTPVDITATSVVSGGSQLTRTIQVVPLPAVASFTSTPTTCDYGSSTTITPVFTLGTGQILGLGSVASGQAVSTGNLTSSKSFTLRVTNVGGDFVDTPLTVDQTALAVTVPSPAAATKTSGDPVTYTATTSGSATTAVTWTADGGAWAGNVWTAPATPGTYTISAHSVTPAGASRSTPVTVVAAPTAALAADVTTVGLGGSANLTATFTVDAGGTAVVNPGAISPTTGVPFTTGILASTITYTLTVTNSAGKQAIRNLTVIVVKGASAITASLGAARAGHTATHLANGDVLVAGGDATGAATAERFAGGGSTFGSLLTMQASRTHHTATLLASGKVLLAGGVDSSGNALATAELYDPSNDSFTGIASPLATPRAHHGAGLLPDGRVLLLGGIDGTSTQLSSTDIYDPLLNTFSPGTSLANAEDWPTATPLSNGSLLATGGVSAGAALGVGQVFSNGAFGGTLSMATARAQHTATLLPGGKVLVVGGRIASSTPLAAVELYSGAFAGIAQTLASARFAHTTDVLPGGLVLITGGRDGGSALATGQIYDPSTQLLWPTGNLVTGRYLAASTLLRSGKVLIAGGSTDLVTPGNGALASAELFDPQDGFGAPAVPNVAIAAPTSAAPGTAGLTASVPSQGGYRYIWTITGGTITGGLGTNSVTFTMGGIGAAVLDVLVVSDRKVPAHGTRSMAMAPSISAFSINPSTNTATLNSTFTWTVTGGSGLTLTINKGVGDVTALGGTTQVPTPVTTTTTYTLTATDVNGTSTSAAILTSVPMPTASNLTAAQSPIEKGSSTTIWPVFATNAGGFGSIDNGVGTVLSGVAYPTGILSASTTFTLSAVNSIGTAATRTLTVNVMPVVVGALTGPTQVTVSSTGSPYGAAVTGAVDKSVTWSVTPAGSIDASGRLTAPATAQDLLVKATSNADPANSNQVTVHVVPVAVATSLTAAVNPVLYGDATTVTPHFSQGTGSLDQGIGAVTGGAAYATGTITTPKTFTLTVTNPAGDLVTFPLVVNPQTVVVNAITGPASGKVTQDRTASYSTSVTGALNTSVTWSSAGAGSWSGSTWTAPHVPGTCTITATAVNGATNTLSISVLAAPAISAFAAAPPGVNRGQASTLTATFTGAGTGDNATGTVTPGNLTLASGGGGVPTGALAVTTPYTLTVTNDAGDSATAQTTVQVFLGAFGAAGTGLSPARNLPTATPLPGGDVLVAGGGAPPSAVADRFDGTQLAFIASQALDAARAGNTATLLPNGLALVAGGTDGTGTLATAALYDPAAGATTATGAPKAARKNHAALLLDNGKVLLAGGAGPLATAELYDPATGTFALTGPMGAARENPTLSRLPDGRILVAGGWSGSSRLLGAEIYDPATGTFSPTGNMLRARRFHTATNLPGGLILMAGGTGDAATGSAEVFSPSLMRFVATGDLLRPRQEHTATLLASGMVLLAGGNSGSSAAAIDQAELYDPTSAAFLNTDFVGTPATGGAAAPLATGQVLLAGGTRDGAAPVAGASLYTPTDGLTMAAANAAITAATYVPQAATSVPAHVTAASGSRYVWLVTGGTLVSGQGTASITFNMPSFGDAVLHVLILTDHGMPSHGQATVVGEPAPQITGFTALVNPVPYGGSTTLTPSYANGLGGSVIGTGAAGSADISSSPASGVPVGVGPFTAPVQFRLTVTNRANVAVNQILTVGVKAVIVSPVSPANPILTAGSSRTFTATVTQAVDTTIVWGATGGTWSGDTWTAPATPGTYTITATAEANGATFSSTTVTVVAPPSGSLAAAASPVPYGATANLTPTFPAGNSGVIGSNGQDSTEVSAAASSGGVYVSAPLAAPATFTLTITNAAGTKATAVTTVTVQAVTVSAITGASYVTVNTSSAYAATVGGAANGGVTWSSTPPGLVNAATGLLSAPATPQDVTLTAASSALGTVTSTFVVHVVAAPTGSLAVGTNPVAYGGSTTLTPTFAAGSTAVLGGAGENSTDVSAGAASGTPYTIGPLTAATPYTLTVTNPAGAKLGVPVTVNVQTVAVAAIAGPANVSVNAVKTYSTSVTGAADTGLVWSSVPAGHIDAATGVLTAPATAQDVVITAASTAQGSVTAVQTVHVVDLPAIQAFTAAPASVNFGQAASLTPTFTGGGAAIGTAGRGSTDLTASAASGASVPTGALGATTTYTLTVTNAAGDAVTRDVPVVVNVSATGAMALARTGQSTTLLADGSVLVAGGAAHNDPAERYAGGVFMPTAQAMQVVRSRHSATLLADGRALLAGGADGSGIPQASAEIFDPADGSFTATPGSLGAARQNHSAVLLPDGRVLLAGGSDPSGPLASAEFFDPATGQFTPAGSGLLQAREDATATVLANGDVLVAGGYGGSAAGYLANAEIFSGGAFGSQTLPMQQARARHTATLLTGGQILLVGGADGTGVAQGTAERFDPALPGFTPTLGLTTGRERHIATLLPSGAVLIAGGTTDGTTPLATAQVYDPTAGSIADTGALGTARFGAGATLLPTGKVLIAGGIGPGPAALAGAELFDAQDGLIPSLAPLVLQAPASAPWQTEAMASVTLPAGGRCVWFLTNGTVTSGMGTPTLGFTMGASGSTRIQVLAFTDLGLPVLDGRSVTGF